MGSHCLLHGYSLTDHNCHMRTNKLFCFSSCEQAQRGAHVGNHPQQSGSGKPPGVEAGTGLHSLQGYGNPAGKCLTTGCRGKDPSGGSEQRRAAATTPHLPRTWSSDIARPPCRGYGSGRGCGTIARGVCHTCSCRSGPTTCRWSGGSVPPSDLHQV